MSVYTPKKPSGDENIAEPVRRLNFDSDDFNEQKAPEVEILSPKELKKKRKEERRAAHPGLYAFLDWVVVIVVALAVALFINFFIIVNSTVPTGSMENTIMSGSRMIGFRVAYLFGEPERGDIIVFRYPDDPSQYFVKRVIGLPGETVEVINGVTYIDGVALEENYINDNYWIEYDLIKDDPNLLEQQGLRYNAGPYTVPEGSYFMMGDNRYNSLDMRHSYTKHLVTFWPADPYSVSYNTNIEQQAVSIKKILGKANYCIWPLSRAGSLKGKVRD